VSKFEDIYGAGYLTFKGLAGEVIRVTIDEVKPEDVKDFEGGGTKPRLVAYFREIPQALILNFANARAIATKCGADETLWSGAEIEIGPGQTNNNQDCLKVTVINPPPGYGGNVVAIKPDKPKPPTDPGLNDAVPF
jgi:hypothetical protein